MTAPVESHGDREPGGITDDRSTGAQLAYAAGFAFGVGLAMGLALLGIVAIIKGPAIAADMIRNLGGTNQ